MTPDLARLTEEEIRAVDDHCTGVTGTCGASRLLIGRLSLARAVVEAARVIIWDKDDEEGLHYCSVEDAHRLLAALAAHDAKAGR